jgi:hypothetical protein
MSLVNIPHCLPVPSLTGAFDLSSLVIGDLGSIFLVPIGSSHPAAPRHKAGAHAGTERLSADTGEQLEGRRGGRERGTLVADRVNLLDLPWSM